MKPSLPTSAEQAGSPMGLVRQEEPGDGARRLRDVWRWLGISGEALGTSGVTRRTFFYCYATAFVVVGGVCAINLVTTHQEEPRYGLVGPIIWEGTSWFTFVLFLWIAWIAYRLAPLNVRPRWRLLIHIPAALLFSLAHVVGFIGLRIFIYWLRGEDYYFGAFVPHFLYEFTKDSFGYVLLVLGFGRVENLLRQQTLTEAPGQTLTFDIRDGSKLTRVRLDQVLAIASAGNYVEFVLEDGRKLLMRSPLSALESELSPRGFLRTHRSWLVNASQMTALKPEGSGDYTVELGHVTAPLSRRFPEALTKLRGGGYRT